MTKLEGRVAIITGAGTGIGASIARALAAAGTAVVLCGRRMQPLESVAEDIALAGGTAVFLPADVAQEEDVARVVATAVQRFGTVDILVNNAGISGGGYIHQHSVAAWDQIMAVNLRGPFLFCRAVLPLMRAQQRGHILNISSEAGLEYYRGSGAYGVAKHALNALGEFIQRENQEQHIRVDTICPGMVVTEMTERSPGLDHARCLTPDDIADLALWLLSRRSNVKIGTAVLIQTMENPWR